MRQAIFYIIWASYFFNSVFGAPIQSPSLGTEEPPAQSPFSLRRRLEVASRTLHARSPLLTQNKPNNKTSSNPSYLNVAPNVEKVNSRNAPPETVVQDAARDLALATKNVDELVMIIQNPTSTGEIIKKAAQEALRNEAEQDFFRQALASATLNATEAQGALGIIRDQAPVVVGGFKEIEKNFEDKKKVLDALKEIVMARLQVVAANYVLIGGIQGGDRKLISNSHLNMISPINQDANGRRLVDIKLKQTIEEAQKNLTVQTKKIDDAIVVIQFPNSSTQDIEIAARQALLLEVESDFARLVLASAARDPKAAMEALGAIRDHGPNEVIAGFKAIEANPKEPASVKRNIELVIKGRLTVVPANLKLIDLAGDRTTTTTSTSAKDPGSATILGTSGTSNTTGTTVVSPAGTTTNSTSTTTPGEVKTIDTTSPVADGSTKPSRESPSDQKKNPPPSDSGKVLKDLSPKKLDTAAAPTTRDPRGLLASLAGDDAQEPSVVLFGSAAKPKA